MPYYSNPCLYLESCTCLKDKIEAYNLLIDAMMLAAEKGALSADIDEYWLDDGQTKIKNIYRSPEAIIKAIGALEKLRQMYINRLNGHSMILRDKNSLIG